jgi:hypothetical protein
VSRITDFSPYFAINPLASTQDKTSFKFSVGLLTSELEEQAPKTARDKTRTIFFMVKELSLKLPKLLL